MLKNRNYFLGLDLKEIFLLSVMLLLFLIITFGLVEHNTSYLFFLCAGICWHINNLFYGYNYYYLMEYFLFYHSYF